jgi:hypothetical protein
MRDLTVCASELGEHSLRIPKVLASTLCRGATVQTAPVAPWRVIAARPAAPWNVSVAGLDCVTPWLDWEGHTRRAVWYFDPEGSTFLRNAYKSLSDYTMSHSSHLESLASRR